MKSVESPVEMLMLDIQYVLSQLLLIEITVLSYMMKMLSLLRSRIGPLQWCSPFVQWVVEWFIEMGKGELTWPP